MNSKKTPATVKNRSRTAKKKTIINSKTILALAGAVFILAIIFFLIPKESQQWAVSKEGILSYPENRGKVDVKLLHTETGSNYTLETISFDSREYTVEGLLRVPLSEIKVPGIVILPGATVTKEGTQYLAGILSEMGYASIGIEQRNRGGVNPAYDFELWKQGKEPVEHKMVFDALRATDVLKQDARIDPQKIAIIGESNGGRFAIIAAALDPSISGVIGISTSGYDTESQIANIRDENITRFYRSIDPETYFGLLPPRKLVMMHSVNDTIIPIGIAEKTFEKAKDPKKFYSVTTGTHGFSEGMRGPLEEELKAIFG